MDSSTLLTMVESSQPVKSIPQLVNQPVKILNSNRTLKDYEIIQELGKGSQGVVYKAKRKSDGKIIALKVMDINPLQKKKINIAKKEVEFLKTLSEPVCNPFVICYYGSSYDEKDGKFLIEMEYIEGMNMADFIKLIGNDKIRYYYLLLIARDIAQGLKYMHSKNIIHRDIKLANIIIQKDTFIPKIIDFGLSCFVESCKGISGTPNYLPPELLTDGKTYPASDMWSLGVTLFRGAMRIAPFKSGFGKDKAKELYKNIKNNNRRNITTSNKLLNDIVDHLLIYNIYLRRTPDQIIKLTDNIERPEEAKSFKYPEKGGRKPLRSELDDLINTDIKSTKEPSKLLTMFPEKYRAISVLKNKLKLKGTVDEIFRLKTLNLNDNELTELPKEIGNLTNLETLNLNDNELTELPKEIGNLTNLENLELTRNELTELPKEIGNLTKLMRLFLSGNKLTNLPKEIGNLTNLVILWLRGNKLTDLPKEIGNLPKLKFIFAEQNNIKKLPEELNKIKVILS